MSQPSPSSGLTPSEAHAHNWVQLQSQLLYSYYAHDWPADSTGVLLLLHDALAQTVSENQVPYPTSPHRPRSWGRTRILPRQIEQQIDPPEDARLLCAATPSPITTAHQQFGQVIIFSVQPDSKLAFAGLLNLSFPGGSQIRACNTLNGIAHFSAGRVFLPRRSSSRNQETNRDAN